MSEYGVTSAGFVKKRFDEIYNEVAADILSGMGLDVTLNPQSIANVLVATFCDRLARLWDLAESVYSSQFPATATGVALDNACSYANIQRRVNEPTKYYVLLVQDGSTPGIYLAGTQAVTQGDNVRYMTSTRTESLMMPSYPASYWAFEVPSQSGQTVTVDIDGVTVSYTTTGNVTTDSTMLAVNIIAALPVDTEFYVTRDAATNYVKVRCAGHLVRTIGYTNLTVAEYGIYCPFEDNVAENVAYNGPVTVTTTNPILWAECKTYERGTLYESDEDFRERYLSLIAANGSASTGAIRSQVLMVDGVAACDVAENKTDATVDNIPAHGIKVYVDAAEGSYYDDAEVATAIYNATPAGIKTSGARSFVVDDYAGNPVTVYWANPQFMTEYTQISIQPNGTLASNYSATAKSLFMELVGKPKMGDAIDLQAIATKIKDAINGAGYVDVACKQSGDATYSRRYLASVPGTKYDFYESNIVVQTI